MAVSVPSLNMAVAGRAGFALYHAAKQRWKLFGNEVQVSNCDEIMIILKFDIILYTNMRKCITSSL